MKFSLRLFLLPLLALLVGPAGAKLNVVATTPDLGAIARAIGGDQIDLTDQLEYILNDIEENKAAIIEDIKNGA